MKTIWKFTLTITDEQVLEMPRGAQILSVQTQYDQPQLWALVDDGAPKTKRRVVVLGTGNDAASLAKSLWRADEGRYAPFPVYVGTFQVRGGSFVGHVFAEPV